MSQTEKPQGRIVYEKDGNVGRITFDNPPAHNALSRAMWQKLGDTCTEIAADRSVRVVTFRGAGGKSFVSGNDISGFLSFESGKDGLAYEKEMDGFIAAVEALPQPTVAVIEGWALGGGLGISLACDFRIATPNSKFGYPVGKTLGNCLSMKSYTRLVAHVGVAHAKRILLYGEMPTAADWQALGVVLDVVERDELDAKVAEVVERLASMAPLTVQASKEAIRRQVYANQPDLDDMVELVYGSEDFRNGVRNFMEKKPQNWLGR